MMDEILAILENIPILLKYFIPGAISIKLFSFLYKTGESDYEYFIFKSVVISGLIVYPLEAIYTNWNDFVLFITTIIIGVFCCYLWAKILGSNRMQAFLQKVHVRKTTRSFWDDVVDMENGSYAEIKLANDNNLYLGSVEYLEDKAEGDIYISITDITVIIENEKKIKQDENIRLVFNTANAEKIIFKSAKE